MEESVRFTSTGGEIAGKWHCPENAAIRVVFSHPHPALGGTMDYPAVRLVCHYLNQAGIATLRYDFRGAGASAGSYDNGVGEMDDLRAAIEYSAQRAPDMELILVGFSFGSWISWRMAEELPLLSKLILLSPPLGADGFRFPPLEHDAQVLALIGDQDQFCPIGQFHHYIEILAPQAEIEVYEGMDHFWLGSERRLAERILAFIEGDAA